MRRIAVLLAALLAGTVPALAQGVAPAPVTPAAPPAPVAPAAPPGEDLDSDLLVPVPADEGQLVAHTGTVLAAGTTDATGLRQTAPGTVAVAFPEGSPLAGMQARWHESVPAADAAAMIAAATSADGPCEAPRMLTEDKDEQVAFQTHAVACAGPAGEGSQLWMLYARDRERSQLLVASVRRSAGALLLERMDLVRAALGLGAGQQPAR